MTELSARVDVAALERQKEDIERRLRQREAVIVRVEADEAGLLVAAEELAMKLPDNVCRPMARYSARIPVM
ncbi:MAG: hypothetical protein J0I08_10190 [Rhizobiales bacterium]|nr:hypothetical protein [Hyphomicrobiales bacterium]